MSNQKKQWGAIIIMIALFAMIAFVTNLCSPMAVIVKNDFGASNVLAQIGNYGNFIAYLVMGIPAGMLIAKFGYKKTALIGLFVGIIGILVQWLSGHVGKDSAFLVYLIGAFISGFTMCILNCVVNPMLNLLGGGGKTGNQLIQTGGVFNSAAAVAVYIIMGALIGDAAKAHIADATPALMIALGIFVVGFIVILFTKINEPEQTPVDVSLIKGAMKFRHFALGTLAIFLYMGIEVGVPTYILQYLTADTPEIKARKVAVLEAKDQYADDAKLAKAFILAPDTVATPTNVDALFEAKVVEDINGTIKNAEEHGKDITDEFRKDNEQTTRNNWNKQVEDTQKKLQEGTISVASVQKAVEGRGMAAGVVGLIVAVYWLMMLVGRFVGASIGGKVSSRTMITTVSLATLLLVFFGMFAPADSTITVPGIDWANLKMIWPEVPVGIFAFLLVGLFTSVMWGGIFNMAVEGLGKYTAIASGIFMTMVFGCAVMVAIQGWVADLTDYMTSYWVVIFCAAYLLFYALIGSKNVNKDIPTE